LCQEQIIVIGEDKTPKLVFGTRGCTYCDECAIACPSDVLLVENRRHIEAKVVINKEKCLSWQGVMCFSCKDPCLENAIDFKAMFMPEINDKCTNCGFCTGRCPADAIDILKVS
jgi:ferredoxin-type protein NapF